MEIYFPESCISTNAIQTWREIAEQIHGLLLLFFCHLWIVFWQAETWRRIKLEESQKKNLHLLAERLASLGIIGDQLRASFKPLITIVL